MYEDGDIFRFHEEAEVGEKTYLPENNNLVEIVGSYGQPSWAFGGHPGFYKVKFLDLPNKPIKMVTHDRLVPIDPVEIVRMKLRYKRNYA
jgi:hypothetical protein